jgi:hypothetical protein
VRIKSHPKQDFSGTYDKTNCLGCHQGAAAHGESGNINGQTCYKCHITPEGRGALLGHIHPKADFRFAGTARHVCGGHRLPTFSGPSTLVRIQVPY